MPAETPVPVPVIPPIATRPPLDSLPTTVVNRNTNSGFTPIGISDILNKENIPIPAPIAAGKPQPAASKKRKSTDAALPEEPAVNLDDINVEDVPRTENCDQIRRKITRFLDSGAMTKTAFCKEIGVSMKSLNGFMGEHGPYKGFNYAAYDGAWEFFKKREIAGLKLPVKRAKKAATTAAAAPAAPAAASGSATTTAAIPVAASSATVDISDVHLEGEETDSVPVYDTCDDVRRKINAHLKKPGVTQAQFGRDVLAQLHVNKPSQIQGTQIARFRNMKGPNAGAKSSVFYGAYVFFEKLRIKEGKPKSARRLEMEKQWPGGFDREHDQRDRFLVFAGETVAQDQYGKLHVY